MLYKTDKTNVYELFKKVKEFYLKNQKSLKLKYAPQYIFKNQKKLINRKDNFFKEFDFNEKEFILNLDNKTTYKFEYNKLLKNQRILNFKNWICNANYFYIKDQYISNECLNFNKKINQIKKLPNTITVCKKNICLDYPQLLSKKIKKDQ